MRGIDLNQPIVYQKASMRYFKENEYHITRVCGCDVLVLVFDGVLRFTEDGVFYEIHPGQYHIQKAGTYQTGFMSSDAPKYLYLEFEAVWGDNDTVLPYCGTFDCVKMKPHLEAMDRLWHNGHMLSEKLAKSYELLSLLHHKPVKQTVAHEIAVYLEQSLTEQPTLEQLANKFHFSKNHIINLFKAEYQMTPIEYLTNLKLRKAERLLEVTSISTKQIAYACGFNDYAYFYKVFLRKHQISPGAWRKQQRV